jgi:hypothetical protein
MPKNLKNFLLNIICISNISVATASAQMLFVPFENESSYSGAWNLSTEIPDYIAAYFREFHSIDVLSSTVFNSLAAEISENESDYDDLEFISNIAEKYGIKFVVMGSIKTFDIIRFTAGEPILAGYESFSCEIDCQIKIYNLVSNSMEYFNDINSKIANRGLGLTLFGKPTEEKIQFYSLNTIRFGGEEFSKTIVGETMFQFCENLSADIKSNSKEILKKDTHKSLKQKITDHKLDSIAIKSEVLKGKILTYDNSTGEAFINLGDEDALKQGEELFIYAKSDSLFDPVSNRFLGISEKRISTIEIIEVRGGKLSLGVVTENRQLVTIGMEIRKIVLKKQN